MILIPLLIIKIWWRVMDEAIEGSNRDISVSTTNTFLCPRRGYMDIKDQETEPGDADNSHFEEMFLQDRILRILTCNRSGQGITCLYKNENYLEDPSALSYFEEDVDLSPRSNTYMIRGVAEDNITVLYFPREMRANIVVLEERKNILQRFWMWTKSRFECVRRQDS